MKINKYKTAAAIRSSISRRLDAEIFELKKRQADILVIEARIALIEEILDTADANGKEEGPDV